MKVTLVPATIATLLASRPDSVWGQSSSSSSSSSSSGANGLQPDKRMKKASLEQPFQDSFKNLQHSPCVSLYYRDGRSGCGSLSRDPQAGHLYYYDGSDGGDNSNIPTGRTFVAVIEEYDLTATTVSGILKANTLGNLKGILVLNSTYAENEDYGSPGPQYPQGYSTPSADISYGNIQYPWNGQGDGLNQYDLYGVPMAYVNEWDTSYYIRQAAKNENKATSIYTRFNYYMGPDGVHSKECLLWEDDEDGQWNPKCLPLGGTSVWAFAGSPPRSQNQQNNNANDNAEEEVADENGNGRKLEQNAANYYNNKKNIMVATSIDSTSMFHDLVPGANEGASNILALVMAAYLLGNSVTDAILDALPNRIVFGFFEGEAYGFLGSRSFLNDVLNFSCDNSYLVKSVANDQNSEMACLYPLRPSLKFQDIGKIAGMLTVDQVGLPPGHGNLYVHNDGGDNMGSFLAYLLKNTGTQYYTAVDSAAGNNANEFPYPPTPLTALQSLTGGAYGGAVLTGYDYAYTKRPPYQSHLNFAANADMNYKAIASAATILARSALAAAYDDGSYDYATASAYAADLIGELSYDNEVLVELADCLFVDGNCQMLKNYASMEASNEAQRTGFDISSGQALGTPPNYYVGVYNIYNGQAFVQVGDNIYGAYKGGDYGAKDGDAFGVQPKMLQQALRGILNSFLGKMSYNENANGSLRSCHKASDCKGVSYCSSQGDQATCTGSKFCVCERAFYHMALDEALEPAINNSTGFFSIANTDQGKSPMWTEPYWSSDVGIKMYRVSDTNPGFIALGFGGIILGVSFFLAVIVKVGLKKEKVY